MSEWGGKPNYDINWEKKWGNAPTEHPVEMSSTVPTEPLASEPPIDPLASHPNRDTDNDYTRGFNAGLRQAASSHTELRARLAATSKKLLTIKCGDIQEMAKLLHIYYELEDLAALEAALSGAGSGK